MFTGIVETLGKVSSVHQMDMSEAGGCGFSLVIADAEVVLEDVHLGDSIACNGVCLTVTEFDEDKNWFKVGCSPETLRKSNLGKLVVGDQINLERALNGMTRFGGHYVQGHVDTTVKIVSCKPDGNSLLYHFYVNPPTNENESDYLAYIIPKGYVCLDGTSLTVIDVDWDKRLFSIMMIAYTQTKVVMPSKQVNDLVNLEVDQVGKYVENMVKGMIASGKGPIVDMVENCVKRILDNRDK